MRRSNKHSTTHTSSEFELDLAPLLAVMVKLVPVLLISSAFVQLSILETELPQVVKEAIERQNQEPQKKVEVAMDVSKTAGFELKITEAGQEHLFKIPLTAKGEFDFPVLQSKLIEFKTKYPEVFKMELNPGNEMKHADIIKIMDQVRQAKNSSTKFKFIDPKTKKEVVTPFMFPEVTFGNMMEGS